MGARKKHAPRRGSLGVRPRKRAARIVPRIKSWPDPDLPQPRLLAFAAYKAGMTHVLMIDDRPHSLTHGKEVFKPVTILEAPPLYILGLRAYTIHPVKGMLTFTEAWITPPKELEIYRKIPTLPETLDPEPKLKLIEENIDRIVDLRVIAATQPKLVGGLSKKKPDLIEIRIGGGTLQDRLKYAMEILGKTVHPKEVFEEGMFVDVIGVTKGHGFQGVIKRFGVKELPRWHKHRKGSRRLGSRSPGIGTISPVPQAGQMGFHRRTEYNKRILKIGDNGLEVTPKGGFINYGIVKGPYIMLEGSVVGPRKRIIILRYPVRPPPYIPEHPPKIVYISLESKQGV